MSVNFLPCPDSLKSIQQFLKTASEHDPRDIVVSYWCRLQALQVGLKLEIERSPQESELLLNLMDWLENAKKSNNENKAITNEVAAQAYLQSYALNLFLYADKQDRAANFDKNVIKAFFTAGVIFDVLTEFGELPEDIIQKRKYSKWKAAYMHNCLKNGDTPIPGPIAPEDKDNSLEKPGTSKKLGSKVKFITQETENESNFTAYTPSNQDSPTMNENISNLSLPSTTPQEDNPCSFTSRDAPAVPTKYAECDSHVNLTPDQIRKAQKYCNWAGSALSYEDIKTAVINLQKALTLLQTGNDTI